MSLPSLAQIFPKSSSVDPHSLSEEDLEKCLLHAMKIDLPLGCEFLHQLAHTDGTISPQDPNSDLGKQIIRICASDPLRRIAEKHLCHGRTIRFYNCCAPQLDPEQPSPEGDPDPSVPSVKEMMLRQIETQTGVIAYADC